MQQEAVLTTAATTTAKAAQLQQLTCLHFWKDASTPAKVQYFCFLADTNIKGDDSNSERGLSTIKHTVYWMTAAPTLSMYSKDNGTTGEDVVLFDAGSESLNDTNSKGWIAYEASSGDTPYGQEASFTASMPNLKFQSMGGNYVANDRKTVRTTMGFQGDAMSSGGTTIDDVSLTAGTLSTIKAGLGTNGFAGTAL